MHGCMVHYHPGDLVVCHEVEEGDVGGGRDEVREVGGGEELG